MTAAVLAGAPCIAIWRAINARPTVQIAPEQLAEFARKREALRTADELFDTGKYAESLQAYETYLARYPYSTVARDGVERTRAALAKSDEKTARAQQSRKKQDPSLMQDIKRSVKRLFGRN